MRECTVEVCAVLARHRMIERRDRCQVRGFEGTDARIGLRGVESGRLEHLVPGLDLEPETFVERSPHLGGGQKECPRTGRLARVDRRLGQRPADAVSSPRGVHPDRADPGGAPVDGHLPGPDDRAVGIGDHRIGLLMAGREVEVRATIAPGIAQHRGDDLIDVGGRHGPDRGTRHRPIVADVSAIIGRMATLSRADVEHVAHLARLGLTDAELGRLEVELNHILDQYAILAELPTDDIPPTAQTIELENILREDVVRPSLPVEAVLANAPARDGDFIVVPAIIDER